MDVGFVSARFDEVLRCIYRWVVKSHRSVVGPGLALPVQDGAPDGMMMAPSIGESRALASGSSSDAIVPAAQALVVVQHPTTRSEDEFLHVWVTWAAFQRPSF